MPMAPDRVQRHERSSMSTTRPSRSQARKRPDIDAGKADEMRATTQEFLASNVVAVKKLRRYAGIANHFASVLYVWRPFLAELWSAIQSAGTGRAGGAPLKCVWRTQILTALVRIRAFLREKVGAIQMCYRVDAPQNAGTLNLLVALRLWLDYWAQERVSLEVRADNLTALNLVLRLKGSTPALNKIAREVALDLGDGSFRPDVCAHVLGVASSCADVLSRRFDPSRVFAVPALHAQAREVDPPTRSQAYWRAATPA